MTKGLTMVIRSIDSLCFPIFFILSLGCGVDLGNRNSHLSFLRLLLWFFLLFHFISQSRLEMLLRLCFSFSLDFNGIYMVHTVIRSDLGGRLRPAFKLVSKLIILSDKSIDF